MDDIEYIIHLSEQTYQTQLEALRNLPSPMGSNSRLIITIEWPNLPSNSELERVPEIVAAIPAWTENVILKLNYFDSETSLSLTSTVLSELSRAIKEKDFKSIIIENLNVWSSRKGYQPHETNFPSEVIAEYIASLSASTNISLNNKSVPLAFNKTDFNKIYAANPQANSGDLRKTVHYKKNDETRGVVNVANKSELSLKPNQFEELYQNLQKNGQVALLKNATKENYQEAMFSKTEIDALKPFLPTEVIDSQWYKKARNTIPRNPTITFNADCFAAIPSRIKKINFSDNHLQFMTVAQLKSLAGLLPNVETLVVSNEEIKAMTPEQRNALIKIAPQAQLISNENIPEITEMNQQILQYHALSIKNRVNLLANKKEVPIPRDTALHVMSFLKRKELLKDSLAEKETEVKPPTP